MIEIELSEDDGAIRGWSEDRVILAGFV